MYGLAEIVRMNEETRALAAVRTQAVAKNPEPDIWPFIVVGEGNPHYRDGIKWYVQGPRGYESKRFDSSAEAQAYAVELKRGSE
jgi:hypothetical protein